MRSSRRSQVANLIEIRVQTEDFSLETEYERCRTLAGGSCGAVASFVGLVRGSVKDTQVDALELEHYPGMTERSIDEIVQQALVRWALQSVIVVHRVGKLTPRSQIVLVVELPSTGRVRSLRVHYGPS